MTQTETPAAPAADLVADVSTLPFPTISQDNRHWYAEQGFPCRADCGRCDQCINAWNVDAD